MSTCKLRVLAIDIGRVDVEIDLTPGISVAFNMFGWIDTNHDGEISQVEGEAYARAMLRSAVLKRMARRCR